MTPANETPLVAAYFTDILQQRRAAVAQWPDNYLKRGVEDAHKAIAGMKSSEELHGLITRWEKSANTDSPVVMAQRREGMTEIRNIIALHHDAVVLARLFRRRPAANKAVNPMALPR